MMGLAALQAGWRRLVDLVRRRKPALPDPNRYGFDERARWKPPGGPSPDPSWINRPERDRLRRDLRSYMDTDR